MLQTLAVGSPSRVANLEREVMPMHVGHARNRWSELRSQRFAPNRFTTMGWGRELVKMRAETKWWEHGVYDKDGKNKIEGVEDISDVEDHAEISFLDALERAQNGVLFVCFYAQWCAACRGAHPRLIKAMAKSNDPHNATNPDASTSGGDASKKGESGKKGKEMLPLWVLKIDYDRNRELCRRLGVKSLPRCRIYRGSDGCIWDGAAGYRSIPIIQDALIMSRMGKQFPSIKELAPPDLPEKTISATDSATTETGFPKDEEADKIAETSTQESRA